MRIYIYVVALVALSFNSYAEGTKSCISFLGGASNSLNVNDNKDILDFKPRASFAKELGSQDVISKAESVIDMALESKLINKPEARHLRADLEALKAERNFKEDHPTFKDILGQWVDFIEGTQSMLQHYRNLSPAEQKAWKSKMELPVYFATAHFIVFLETKNNKNFDYAKMTTLLKVARVEEFEGDIKLYLYAFEKQVRRYFSTKEFRKCRA